MLCLTACGSQTVKPSETDDCVPDVEIAWRYKNLPAELLIDYRCPVLPPDGSSNENFISWAEACASAAKSAADNLAKIRELQSDQP